ncbi:MAG: hypothetical protein Hyperionvirus38_7 [Hyperionvirus sp.]|uniref:Uncharacterized protein n=1 Tax=Hyperionvirus sp. TaxID=2487770 RepID=A0A3G5AH90_9VIRU|nr:MAG: hypothetical protein Hyperionvirus38_7 [Hyperionvirus sp.]
MGPKIDSCERGVIKVGEAVYVDCKMYPSGSVEWDWKLTGTRHKPGIQLADLIGIKEFEDKNCVIVLSTGMDRALEISPEVVEYFKENKREYYIAETREAVRMYNKLIECDRLVVGLFHSNC